MAEGIRNLNIELVKWTDMQMFDDDVVICIFFFLLLYLLTILGKGTSQYFLRAPFFPFEFAILLSIKVVGFCLSVGFSNETVVC